MRATLGVNDKIAGISLDPFIAFNARSKPEVNVCIDERKSAEAQLALGTQVIFRWSDDDHAHERYNPKKFVQALHDMAPPGCVLHLGNEPGRDNLPLLDSWTVSALEECNRLERKGAIFSFATGQPEPSEWGLLRRSMTMAARFGHWLDLHQYFDGRVARSFPDHIGRHVHVYQAFGASAPQIVIGELGCAVGGNAYAGWQTYLTPEQYTAELLKAQAVYRERGIPACIFLWGPWDKTTTFDIRGELDLQEAIVRANMATMPIIEPPKPGTPAIVGRLASLPATYTYRYVRAKPDITSESTGAITLLEPVEYYPDDVRNGWMYVQSRQTPAEKGWLFQQGTTFLPDPPAATSDVTLTRAEYDQILSIFKSAEARQGGKSS